MENAELPGQEQPGINWLSLTLNVIIIFLGLILIVLTLHYGFTDCDKLRFDVSNKTMNAGEFMEVYSDECLDKTPENFINLSLQYSQSSP